MRFTEKNQGFYLGKVNNCYLGFASDREIRMHCASGGIVSAILIELLEAGTVNGAVVSKIELDDGEILGRAFIATSREEILSCGGSIYFNVKPLSLQRLKSFPGRLAVVGLPCQINTLTKSIGRDEELSDKIAVKIGLFCGHNSSKALLIKVLEKKRINIEDIERFSFRKGRWRGRMQISMKCGRNVDFPFSHFSVYQNLHLFSLKKCLYCTDHTAEYADISCGDVWLKKMKKEAIKHSIFLSRNQKGNDVLDMVSKKRAIKVKDSSPKEVFLSQKRSLLHHKSLYARSRLSGLFGYNIKCTEKGDTRWNDYLSTLISMSNIKWSESKGFQKLIFFLPRQILFLYLLVFKLLTNF